MYESTGSWVAGSCAKLTAPSRIRQQSNSVKMICSWINIVKENVEMFAAVLYFS